MLFRVKNPRGLRGLRSWVNSGLLKASFVPPEPVRHLRDLTRYGSTLTVERTREAQRLEKELEDALLTELPEEVSRLSGKIAQRLATVPSRDRNSGAGQDDAQTMSAMARRRLRSKIPARG